MILGISSYYHDSSASIIDNDGKIIAAAQEERFSRVKGDKSFPYRAIQYCCKEAKVSLSDLEQIVFYEDTLLKFKRISLTLIKFFPKSFLISLTILPIWLIKKLYWKKNLKKEFYSKLNYKLKNDKISFCQHHRSHAASAFFPSKFDESAILVLDGVGEKLTSSIWHGKGNKIKYIDGLEFPDSLGLLYSAFTSYIGFKVNSGEYKLMGLAPFGEAKYVDIIKKELIKIYPNGKFKLNMKYFDFHISNHMLNKKFYSCLVFLLVKKKVK